MSDDEDDLPISSPCRRLCQLHPIERYCLGCFRKIEEIADWARLSRAEQAAIVAALPERRKDWETRRRAERGHSRWR